MEVPRVVVVGDLLYDLLARVDGEVRFGTDTFIPIRAAGVETHFVSRAALYADAEGRRSRVSAEQVRLADTTGAGDALCAGFLSAWLAGAAPEEALRRGVGTAARAVEIVGGRPGAYRERSRKNLR